LKEVYFQVDKTHTPSGFQKQNVCIKEIIHKTSEPNEILEPTETNEILEPNEIHYENEINLFDKQTVVFNDLIHSFHQGVSELNVKMG